LVPEKREELTTEGGLEVAKQIDTLTPYIRKLQDNGSRVSLFIDADKKQIEAAAKTEAKVVELHTGTYAHEGYGAEVIAKGAALAHSLGLEVHAGHGLNYDNTAAIAAIPEIM